MGSDHNEEDFCLAESIFFNGLLQVVGAVLFLGLYGYKSYFSWGGGNQSSSNILPLPIYYPLIYFTIAFTLGLGLLNMLSPKLNTAPEYMIKWFFWHFLAEGIAFFLQSSGVGLWQAKRAVLKSLLLTSLSTATGMLVYVYASTGDTPAFLALMISNAAWAVAILGFYLVMWLAPHDRVSRRPALVKYSRYMCVLLSVYIVVVAVLAADYENLESRCALDINFAFSDSLTPVVILRAFFEDSRFWQGLWVNTAPDASGSSQRANLNEPLLGVWSMGRRTVGLIAEATETVMRTVVPVIPFSALRLDTRGFFSGGTARVYKGSYQNRTVAVKIVFCMTLTPERVMDFCEEASLLSSLQHPNIVSCFGVAIMPPAMSLVTEFCIFGSLYDFLHNEDVVVIDAFATPYGASKSDVEGGFKDEAVTLNDLLHLSAASDSAAAMHAATPPGVPPSPLAPRASRSGPHVHAMQASDGPAGRFVVMTTRDYVHAKKRAMQRAWLESVEGHDNGGEDSSAKGRSYISGRTSRGSAEALQSTFSSAAVNTPLGGGGGSEPQCTDYRIRILSEMMATDGMLDDTMNTSAVLVRDLDTKMNPDTHTAPFPALPPSASSTNTNTHAHAPTPMQSAATLLGSSEMGFGWGASSSVAVGATARRSRSPPSPVPLEARSVSGSAQTLSGRARLLTRSWSKSRSNSDARATAETTVGTKGSRKRPSLFHTVSTTDSREVGGAGRGERTDTTSPVPHPCANPLNDAGWDYSGGVSSASALSGASGRPSSAADGEGLGGDSDVGFAFSGRTTATDITIPLGLERLPLALRARMVHDCCAGLAFLHSKGFLHCDVKSLNFLVDRNLNVKLSDLGEARISTDIRDSQLAGLPNTINWSAPEVLQYSGDAPVRESADVWSLAMVFTEILALSIPFDTPDCHAMTMNTFLSKLKEEPSFRPAYEHAITSDKFGFLHRVVQGGWRFNPQDRLTCIEMLAIVEDGLSALGMNDESRAL